MWTKLKKGVENIRVIFRVPQDEWEKFRACSPTMTISEQVRLALKQYVVNNRG